MFSTVAAVHLRTVIYRWMPSDSLCVLSLVFLSLLVAWGTLSAATIRAADPILFFYPMYSFLGEQLRAGDIPGWNPHQFAGAPFAADPQSGWMYLPAMALFSLLPLGAAANAFVVSHWLLAGVGMYALARVLGMSLGGALIAGVGYEFGGLAFRTGLCCPPYAGTMAWLPLALLCTEMGIRSRACLNRYLWLGGAGLALSQILAVWLGQGSYYALLALGAYTAYRTLLVPPDPARRFTARIIDLTLYGCGVLGFGFGFAAAGLLPRLEYNALSSLANGYEGIGEEAEVGGWGVSHWVDLLNPQGITWYEGAYTNAAYVGGMVFALALSAPLVARSRFVVPYSASLCLGALVLSNDTRTPLHSLLYILPGFARLHPHFPDRIMVLFYIGAALLTGATVTHLDEVSASSRRYALVALAPIAAALALWLLGGSISGQGTLALSLGVVLLAAYAFLPVRRQYLTILLVLVLFADLWVANQGMATRQGLISLPKQGRETWLAAHYEPTGAISDLLSRTESTHSRFFGYTTRYQRLLTPLGGNQATLVGLEDIQGYNPVQVARYSEYIRALNGRPHEYYRRIFVSADGLRSPLLDVLNARYVLAPADVARNLSSHQGYRTRYEDEHLHLLERPEVLPRVWLAYSARQATYGQALSLLSSGQTDPKHTVLLEAPPPPLIQPQDASKDQARITAYEPDRIDVQVSTQGQGLLVLSEVYYPAWKAYVDGKEVPLLVAYHTLRAVPVPTGIHDIELRYESRTLQTGLVISLLTFGLLLVGLLVTATRKIPARIHAYRR